MDAPHIVVGVDGSPVADCHPQPGMTDAATVSLVVRSLPPGHGFLVAAGLARALAFLEEVRLDGALPDHRDTPALLPDDAVGARHGSRFSGEVWAVPDGRIVFAGEPLLEVTGPIAEAQLAMTALRHIVTRETAAALGSAPGRRRGTVADGDHAPHLTDELVAVAGQPVMTLSGRHASLPGAKQVFRDEITGEDILALRGEPTPARHAALLRLVMTAGRRVTADDEYGPVDDAAAAYRRSDADRARLPEQSGRFDHPTLLLPMVSVVLRRLHDQLHERLRYRDLLGPRLTGYAPAQRSSRPLVPA